MNIDPAVSKLVVTIGIISGVIAAVISSLFQVINGWRERLAADKRHLRDIALKAAIVQWEYDVERVSTHNKKVSLQGGLATEPKKAELTSIDFDMILVQKLKLIEVFGSGRISGKDIERGWGEMANVANAISKRRYPPKADGST